MSELYRSEDMSYIRLLMTEEVSYDTVRQLGELAKLHIVDVNNTNKYVNFKYFVFTAVDCLKIFLYIFFNYSCYCVL
jgi:hypothetical protein